jgi:hypothetical protein
MKREIPEIIRKAIEYKLATLRVAMPAQVQAYDASAKTVDVQPMLDESLEADDDVITEALPVLKGIPVALPGAGGFYLSLPITLGDTGLIVFTDFPMDFWLQTGQKEPTPVQDMRAHSEASAVFIPGVTPVVAPGAAVITVLANGNLQLGVGASDYVVLESKMIAKFNAHTHPTGTGPSGAPTVPLVTADVGSIVVQSS